MPWWIQEPQRPAAGGDWYQKWKDHLGALIKSKVRIIGVGHDPIKVKGADKATDTTLGWSRRQVPANDLDRSD